MGFLLLMFLAIFTVEQANSYDYHYQRDTSVECLVTYLKEQNENDEFFSSLQTSDQISQECRAGVAFEKENLLAQAQLTMQFRNNFNCLQGELWKSEQFRNRLLKMRAVKSMSDGSGNWLGRVFSKRKTPRDYAIDRIDTEITSMISMAEVKCDLTPEFGDLFDSFFDNDRSGINFVAYETAENNCIRKELKDNAIIDFSSVEGNLNQENFSDENVNCNKIMEYLKTEMIESLNDFDSDNTDFLRKHCSINILRESNDYFHQLLKAEFMKKNIRSINQRESERKIFIDKMIEVALKIRERCA